MPRRGLDGTWDVSPVASARLDRAAREALAALRAAWGCSDSAAVRRALVEAGARLVDAGQRRGGPGTLGRGVRQPPAAAVP